MRLVHDNEIRESLDEAINGRLCIQAWIGYGNDLFLGFGEVIPNTEDNSRHFLPPYEIQSVFSNWYLEGPDGLIGESVDEHESADATVKILVGKHATGWKYIGPPPSLKIFFEGGITVKIKPMVSIKRYLHKKAWNLRLSDGFYISQQWNGVAYMVHEDEPGPFYPEKLLKRVNGRFVIRQNIDRFAR